MRRLCIYVTFNKECLVKPYVGYMLNALNQCGIDTYLVCNFLRANGGIEYAEPYVKGIYYRENIGYDSGAYRDALFDYLGWDRVYDYDELLLVNDSFFGPIFPLEEYFEKIEDINCDFWGMTRSMPGELKNPYYLYGEHIQSYFLTFRNNVLHSRQFRFFWENYRYPKNFREAVVKFELDINKYLTSYGFVGYALNDCAKIKSGINENPYLLYPYELINDCKVPVLKRKSISVANIGLPSALRAIKYIKSNSNYPVEWIENVLEEQFCIDDKDFDRSRRLEEFYYKFSQIYIYGAGVCARNLALWFKIKGWHFDKYIVTNKSQECDKVISFEEAEITPRTGIVISVINSEVSDDIDLHIGKRCKKEQLFFISKCRGA